MRVLGIIPARYNSSRFPGKPLADIRGQTMLSRVHSQALKAEGLAGVLVATDDQRIVDHARSIGAETVMTSPDHPSGTDRCWEAYRNYGREFDHVINIQCDEPFIDPRQIDSMAEACRPDAEIITQMSVCTDPGLLFSPSEVKIVLNAKNEALYFSRAVIPFQRDRDPGEWAAHHKYYRHVGLYGYRVDVLERICALPPSPAEESERLEQLRWLHHGFRISCVETQFESYCIDTPGDIEKVLRLMNIGG